MSCSKALISAMRAEVYYPQGKISHENAERIDTVPIVKPTDAMIHAAEGIPHDSPWTPEHSKTHGTIRQRLENSERRYNFLVTKPNLFSHPLGKKRMIDIALQWLGAPLGSYNMITGATVPGSNDTNMRSLVNDAKERVERLLDANDNQLGIAGNHLDAGFKQQIRQELNDAYVNVSQPIEHRAADDHNDYEFMVVAAKCYVKLMAKAFPPRGATPPASPRAGSGGGYRRRYSLRRPVRKTHTRRHPKRAQKKYSIKHVRKTHSKPKQNKRRTR